MKYSLPLNTFIVFLNDLVLGRPAVLTLLRATSGDPESINSHIHNAIDKVDSDEKCFVSAGTSENNWALFDIPWAFVSSVKLLNRNVMG